MKNLFTSILFSLILSTGFSQVETSIFGNIYKVDSPSVGLDSADVYLYDYDTSKSIFPLFGKIKTDAFGQYLFDSTFIDADTNKEYILLVKPNLNKDPGYSKTYYDLSQTWYKAKTINNSWTGGSGVDVFVDTLQIAPGCAVVSGVMKETLSGTGFGKIQGPGDPFNGIDVSLIDKSTGSAIAHDVTKTVGSDSGIFDFQNVASGNYYIYCGIPGIFADTNFIVNVDTIGCDSTTNVLVYVDSSEFTYDLDTATIGSFINTTNSSIESFILSPNPVNDVLQIEYVLNKQSDVNLSIYGMDGKKIVLQNKTTQNKGPNGMLFIPTKYKLTQGIYFIEIRIDEQSFRKRFIYIE